MKKSNIILLIVAAVLVIGYFAIRSYLQQDVDRENGKNPGASLDLRPLFIAKIQQLVKDGSKGLYNLSIDSMDVDLLQSRVVLRDVKLSYDNTVLKTLDSMQQAPDDVFNAAFDSLRIEGINLNDVVTGNTIDFEGIFISKPTIEVFHEKRQNTKTVDSLTLYDRIMKNMERIAVAKVNIQQGQFISNNKAGNKIVFDNIAISLDDILIDSSTEHATDRFLFASQASFSLKNYEMKSKDNAYVTRIGSLKVTAPEREMTISNISVRSRYTGRAYQQRLTHQKEQYDFSTPSITIRNVDWWALMHDSLFVADELTMSGGALKIYLDRTLPRPKSKMGNFPHQLIMKLPFRIDINKANIKSFDLKYDEFNPKSGDTGSVQFTDINLNVSGVTNLPTERKKKKHIIVTGSASFKNVPVKAKFTFDLVNPKSGRFSANFSTDDFEANVVNHISQPLGLMKFEKGQVNKLDVSMQGDEKRANGKVLMLYNDFKISIYKNEKNKEALNKRNFLGFIVNTFVVKDNNPSGDQPARNPNADFVRDPQTGFFSLVWKTTLNGILKTIGANPELVEK